MAMFCIFGVHMDRCLTWGKFYVSYVSIWPVTLHGHQTRSISWPYGKLLYQTRIEAEKLIWKSVKFPVLASYLIMLIYVNQIHGIFWGFRLCSIDWPWYWVRSYWWLGGGHLETKGGRNLRLHPPIRKKNIFLEPFIWHFEFSMKVWILFPWFLAIFSTFCDFGLQYQAKKQNWKSKIRLLEDNCKWNILSKYSGPPHKLV